MHFVFQLSNLGHLFLDKVGARTSQVRMTPTGSQLHSWGAYNEDVFSLEDSSTFEAVGLLEQINITRDNSDYLWYITR